MEELFAMLRNELNITWNDDETNLRLSRIVANAVETMNFKLGANIDYTQQGIEQELFLAYCVYVWNNCANEFDTNYLNDIYQVRQKYEVLQYGEQEDN